jgi:molecular chaperone DnaK
VAVGDLTRIEGAIAAVRDAVKGDSLEAIRRAHDELQKASHAIAEQLYKQQAAGTGPQAATKNDDVKEGEVVEA